MRTPRSRRRLRDRLTAVIAAVGIASLAAGAVVIGSAAPTLANNQGGGSDPKVVVCKYVGAPGESELVQTGQNPIEVSSKTLKDWDGVTFPYEFVDAQGGSIAVGFVGDVPSNISACNPVVAQPPTVIQSPACEVEGSYEIPSTEGVQYLLDGEAIAAGTYTGPKTGTVTAVALDTFWLVNPEFSFLLNVPAAVDCEAPPTTDVCTNLPGVQVTVPVGYTESGGICTQVPPPPTDVCTNIDGVQTAVPDGYEVEDGVCTLIEPEPEDVCTNIEGVQSEVPEGYAEDDGVCIEIEGEEAEEDEAEEPEVKPAEEERPKPTKPVKPAPVVQPDQVAGTEAALPTTVDAGLAGPTGAGGSTTPLGQGLMAAGLVLIALAGVMKVGRRERGVHEA